MATSAITPTLAGTPARARGPGWIAFAACTALAALLVPSVGGAAPPDPRLVSRLDSATVSGTWAIAESARVAGLPTEPLVARALEGAARRASSARIVAAVRRHAMALAIARDALGRASAEAEIVAGATVVLAGIPADSLVRLRAIEPGRSLVVPLVLLGDLVARRVPGAIASSVVLDAAHAGVKDSDLLELRQRVERDIAAGADPSTAARVRTNGMLMLHTHDAIRGRPGPARNERPPSGGVPP